MNLLIKFFLSAFLTFSQGEIAPIERKSCKLIEYIDNLYEHADLCVVIYYEKEAAYDCPLAMNTTRSIHVTHEVVMGWTAFSFQDRFECRKFLIGTSDPNVIEEFFTKRSTYPRFLPFTNIILFNSSSSEEIQLTLPQTRYSYYNGLYMFSAFFGRNGMFTLKNLLTNETMHGTEASIASVPFGALKHPLLNGRLYPREINITLFHCPPFVIINHDNVTNETTYDGVEYNLIESITEGWNRGIVQRGFGDPKISPWTQIVKDVQSGEANVALCSPWLNIKHYRVTDLSQSYDQQCLTFLVPRPRIVTAASYIYLPFSGKVWFAYIACLIGIALILHYFVNRDFIRSNDLSSLEVVFLEVINIATSHGATRFPRQVPIKILLTSWLAISLLLSTAYCTGYTSLLTTPRFTKPIDTIADFLDQGITWGSVRISHDFYEDLKASENKDLVRIGERYVSEKDVFEGVSKIKSGTYAMFTKILSNNLVTDTETYASEAHMLRRMKDCVNRYYAVFLLSKKSPYTQYISHNMLKYLESGIVTHWFTDTNIRFGKSYITSFFDESIQKIGDARSLKAINVLGAFYLLVIGLVLAIGVFVMELLQLRVLRATFPPLVVWYLIIYLHKAVIKRVHLKYIYWGDMSIEKGMFDDFVSSENPELFNLANRYRIEKNIDEQLQRIESGKYAKFAKVLSNNYITETETFASHAQYLRRMNQCIYRYYSVFLLRKKSPYTRFIGYNLHKLLEAGFISHWFTETNIKYGKSYIASFFDQYLQRFGEAKSLRIENVLGAFYLLGVGLFIALIVFIIEIYIHVDRQKNKN